MQSNGTLSRIGLQLLPKVGKRFLSWDSPLCTYFATAASLGFTSQRPQLRHPTRCFSASQETKKRSRNTSKDVELGAVGVAGAEGAVRKAEEAVEFAVSVVKQANLRCEKWRNSKQGKLTGSEPAYLLFKEELDSARAQLKEREAALDRARAFLDSTRAYYLNRITGGRLNTLLPRPESVFSDDRWRRLVRTNPGLELSDSEFLKSLLDDRYVEVKSIHELPIANPLIGCITSYTDPITKVQVICLPQPLPSPTMIGSHIIFVRPFNITMMNAMLACKTDRILVVGNVGIGKSYMQLLILLWWARRDLRPEGTNWDQFFNEIQVVARLERGGQTDLFFKRDKKHYKMDSTNRLPELRPFDSKSTLFLYEPQGSTDEIANCGTACRLWATVSPLPKRYKEFSKMNCALKYMECASEDELTFMARVLALGIPESSSLAPLYEPHAVLERIRVLGPFQRVVLPSSREGLNVQMQGRLSALDSLSAELLLKARNISEEGSTSQLSISHHILRISPADSKLGTYTLKASSEQVTEWLSDRLYETELSNMKHRLSCYNEDPDSQTITPATKGSISTVLESFFAKNAVSNDNTKFLGWEVSKTMFSDDPDNKGWKPEWGPFSMNLDKMERSKNPPTFQEIVNSPGTLFWMRSPNYPFVDFFCYDAATGTVQGFQASKSESGHAKSIETWDLMVKSLEMPLGGKLVVNIVPLPRQVEGYVSGGRSMFFADVKKRKKEIDEIGKKVEFRVIKMVLV